MTISMNTVESGSIFKIGYRRRTLKVQFNSGRIYEFRKVPRAKYDQLLNAPSKGSFFNREIKGSYVETEV
jgi:lysyl-tRNA synthetase class 2